MPIDDATASFPLTTPNARPYLPRTRLRVSRNTMPAMTSTRCRAATGRRRARTRPARSANAGGDALRATGESLQPLRQRHADDRQRDRHHGDRESAQPRRGQRHQQPHDAGIRQASTKTRTMFQPCFDAVRGDVRAEAHEEDLAERDLPGVAHDDVEAQHGDGVDADPRERLVGEGRQARGGATTARPRHQRRCPPHPRALPQSDDGGFTDRGRTVRRLAIRRAPRLSGRTGPAAAR